MNVPSSYDGIPLFAHNLDPALRSHGVGTEGLRVTNHAWIERPKVLHQVEATETGRFRLNTEGAVFSFHRGEAIASDDKGRPLPQTVTKPWGRVQVVSPTVLDVEIDPTGHGDLVLAYDAQTYKTVMVR